MFPLCNIYIYIYRYTQTYIYMMYTYIYIYPIYDTCAKTLNNVSKTSLLGTLLLLHPLQCEFFFGNHCYGNPWRGNHPCRNHCYGNHCNGMVGKTITTRISCNKLTFAGNGHGYLATNLLCQKTFVFFRFVRLGPETVHFL